MDVPDNPLTYFVAIGGSFMALYGATMLLVAWFAPAMLERRLFRPQVLGRFPRTRTNLTLVSCWAMAWGAFLLMSALGANVAATLWTGALAAALVIPAARVMRSRPQAAPSGE